MKAKQTNMYLVEELKRVRRDSGVTTPVSSPLNPLYDTPLALSQELFSSHDNTSGDPAVHLVDQLITSTANPTVNPASLSPELTPVPDEPNTECHLKFEPSEETSSTSPDLTQHPAEMLFDLQCHISGKAPKSFLDSQAVISKILAWSIQFKLMIFTASAILSACQRPLTQIAISLKAGFSLLPTPQLLATIIWLVTVPPTSRVRHTSSSSTWMTSSATRRTTSSPTSWQRATMSLQTTASSPPSTTLRLKFLLNILACSPNLARPLSDATMEALRLVSEGCDDRVGGLGAECSGTRDQVSKLTQCLRGIVLPSREILMTLLWVLKVKERKISQRNVRSSRRERNSSDQQSTAPTSLLVVANKVGITRIRKRYQRKCQ